LKYAQPRWEGVALYRGETGRSDADQQFDSVSPNRVRELLLPSARQRTIHFGMEWAEVKLRECRGDPGQSLTLNLVVLVVDVWAQDTTIHPIL
jgi:hypothetical protein